MNSWEQAGPGERDGARWGGQGVLHFCHTSQRWIWGTPVPHGQGQEHPSWWDRDGEVLGSWDAGQSRVETPHPASQGALQLHLPLTKNNKSRARDAQTPLEGSHGVPSQL